MNEQQTSKLIDVLNGERKTIQCLDKGHISMVDCMPRLIPEGKTGDYRIVQAARVSYG